MPDDPIEERQELRIAHDVYVGDGRPPFIGEVVRFRGKSLGAYKIEDSVDESRLKRKLVQYVLFRSPDGYRVYRSELDYRPKERSRWQRKEAFRSLLPTIGE